MDKPNSSSPSGSKSYLSLVLRLLVVSLIGYWLYQQTDHGQLKQSLTKAPWAIGLAALIGGLNLAVAALRWRLLMSAFGAQRLPRLPPLFKLNLVGHFYNIFVPGAVGGDVGRGYVARTCFSDATTSYFVVISERLVGLTALGFIFGVGVVCGPSIPGLSNAGLWAAVLMGFSTVLIALYVLAGRLRRWWSAFPRITRPLNVLAAGGLSLFTHGMTIVVFGILSAGLGIKLDLSILIVVVPVALVASIVPLAIAGIGPREAALVGLLPAMDVASSQDALALSLSFALSHWVLAGMGGLVQLVEGQGLLASLTDSDEEDTDLKASVSKD
jgi:uncharacterized membrane protein YbhN (UPF0104 family)